MLVLSRRVQDSIRFPELDITIEILQIKGSTARVGIDAPVEIQILRGELEANPDSKVAKKILINEANEHDTRNKLNNLMIATAFARKLIEKGEPNLAAEKLDRAISDLGQPIKGSTNLQALLVEDSDNEREMLAGFLRLHGYKVTTVVDGIEAMEYLESNEKPDLILMDMNMPRLDGKSTIKMVRDNVAFDDVQIFAISGQTPQSSDVDVAKNRIAHWFQKPLRPNDLVDAILNCAENSQGLPHQLSNNLR
ncbi:MAG: response regulator [Mariniblastus sp.]